MAPQWQSRPSPSSLSSHAYLSLCKSFRSSSIGSRRIRYRFPASLFLPKHEGRLIQHTMDISLRLSRRLFHLARIRGRSYGKDDHTRSVDGPSHGKKVLTDYSITIIQGDGRCLFRSVMHGACIISGMPLGDEEHQRNLADNLRAMVADELVKRKTETECIIEGDFDTYIKNIRKPQVWGGEPELFMASHVLQMPITVYMLDKDSGGLMKITEYGQEYGNKDSIRVLFHDFGHYDSVQIP